MAEVDGFAECKAKMKALVANHISNQLAIIAEEFISDAMKNKNYSGFTGNTQTSYSCGIFVFGTLTMIISQGDKSPKPVRKKVKYNKRAYISKPYEGIGRAVKGTAHVDNLYGQQTSEAFIRSYKGIPSDSIGIVMSTGTEYSTYIEEVSHRNVLTKTYLEAGNILGKNIKPIS